MTDRITNRQQHLARYVVCGAVLVLVDIVAPSSVAATWSIAAIDRATGDVGIAAASCTQNVQGVASILPGVGVVVVQAASSNQAREKGMELLRQGHSPAEIIHQLREDRFDPENQQYAVVASRAREAATYSGARTGDVRGALTDEGVAVQGNMLASENVLPATLKKFRSEVRLGLAERLVAALAVGAREGGDRRCGEQRATSAYVTVYRASDKDGTPYVHIAVYGIDKGKQPAVDVLLNAFARWKKNGKDQTSTRIYFIP